MTITYKDDSTAEHETDENGEYRIDLDITDGSADVVPLTIDVREQSEDVLIHDSETPTVSFPVEESTVAADEDANANADGEEDNETAAVGMPTLAPTAVAA